MPAEPQSTRATVVARVAKLSDVTVRRSPYAAADKDGDITAALAAMPPSAELLDRDSVVAPGAGNLRDVTPGAAASSRDILEYWDRLRGTDAMPHRNRLKASEVAARWPHLVLFRCSRGVHPDTAFSTALRANRGGGGAAALPREPETAALLSQWMLRVARAVAEDGAPARDRMHIDTAAGRIEYAMSTLPFAGDEGEMPGYVLCCVEPLK